MFPWNFFGTDHNNHDIFEKMNDKDFQKMLENWMKQAFPSYLQTMKNTPKSQNVTMNESVFETHDNIYIRIPIEKDEIINRVKIFYSLNKCIINGIQEKDKPYTIILPSTVKKKGARAVYRDRILEIKIPKSVDWQFSEIDVDADH